ncbi:hypothetical protein LFAB_15670 [Lactiplantibacillus fabifermentans T30PCM01]|uniref:Phosphatidic acid phosphatase type 2/haloperoxidase domain-containing protein n=1 Tax=Lactiplantibacillus fabifermentans T30PCM01 TaxID=1400520 RepID=W6TBK7_9LACO|nr:phosphatase PAP2 family protein [Lactiplantibacillus fabifermentans]ETY72810.1 hypothetical protein LFAB_15670 [Lactiplantibacillus fabifermentans T30PCM01]
MLINQGNERQVAWSFFGLFAILAILVKINASIIQTIDQAGFDLLSHLDSPTLTQFFKVIATLGSPAVTVVVAVVFGGVLFLKHYRSLGILAVTTMFGGDAVALLFKNLVQRNRPTQQLVPDTGYSFPSGHVFGTMLLVAIVVGISLQFISSQPWRWTVIIAGILWVLLVMVSRVYLRDHFTTDTVGSLCLASGTWYQAKAWFARWQPKLAARFNFSEN